MALLDIFTPPTAFIERNQQFLKAKIYDCYALLIPLENQFYLAFHSFQIREFLYLLEKELEDKEKTGNIKCYLWHPVIEEDNRIILEKSFFLGKRYHFTKEEYSAIEQIYKEFFDLLSILPTPHYEEFEKFLRDIKTPEREHKTTIGLLLYYYLNNLPSKEGYEYLKLVLEVFSNDFTWTLYFINRIHPNVNNLDRNWRNWINLSFNKHFNKLIKLLNIISSPDYPINRMEVIALVNNSTLNFQLLYCYMKLYYSHTAHTSTILNMEDLKPDIYAKSTSNKDLQLKSLIITDIPNIHQFMFNTLVLGNWKPLMTENFFPIAFLSFVEKDGKENPDDFIFVGANSYSRLPKITLGEEPFKTSQNLFLLGIKELKEQFKIDSPQNQKIVIKVRPDTVFLEEFNWKMNEVRCFLKLGPSFKRHIMKDPVIQFKHSNRVIYQFNKDTIVIQDNNCLEIIVQVDDLNIKELKLEFYSKNKLIKDWVVKKEKEVIFPRKSDAEILKFTKNVADDQRIDRPSFRNFIQNFDENEEKYIALRIIQKLMYVKPEDLSRKKNELKDHIDAFKANLGFSGKVQIIPLHDGEIESGIKSADVLGYYIKPKIKYERIRTFNDLDADRPIVVIEDFSGTGSQTSKCFDKFFSTFNERGETPNVLFIVVYIYESALKIIESKFSEKMNIKAIQVIPDSDRVLEPGFIFESHQIERVKAFLLKHAKNRPYAFGRDDSGSIFVNSLRCSNNVPQFLWSPKSGGYLFRRFTET